MANKDPNSPRSSQGLSPAGLGDIEGLAALVDALEDVQTGGKKGSKELKNLNDRMEILVKATKKSKDPVVVLTTVFGKMKKGSDEASNSITVLTAEIEKSVEVMTSSSKATLEKSIEGIKKMQAELVASGKGNSREAVMLNTKRSQLQMQAFKDEKNFMIERAKMLQQGSEGVIGRFKGVGMGVLNATMKHGTAAAEALGGALGLTSGAMMAVAAAAGVILAGFAAFIFVAKRSSKMMNDMAEAGDTTSSSLDEMRARSQEFFQQTADAAGRANMTFDKMQGLLVDINKEYGFSLGLGADFAGTVANVGKTFGMANEESVKLATKMAVLARTTNQLAIKQVFTAFGVEAAKLRLPLDALAEPMMALSELAGRTGHDVNAAADSLGLIIHSVETLKTSGISMFRNMQSADIAKFTKEFSGFITGMDQWTLAAMTFKDNETFQGMTERVASMDTRARINAIRDMMKENELFGPQHASELGAILGGKTPEEMLQRGKIAQAAVSGNMNDSEYNSLMAKDINRQLADRKTAGEAIQFGVDPTAFMMDRVQRILDSLINIQNVILFWKGSGPKNPAQAAAVQGAVPASGSYAASALAGRRQSNSAPVSSSALR